MRSAHFVALLPFFVAFVTSARAADAEPATTPVDSDASATEVITQPTDRGPPFNVGYERGFYIQSSDGLYKLKLNGRVQARYTQEHIPEGIQAAFVIPRARLGLSGHVFTSKLTYKFQADFGKGFASLKDFFVDYAAVKSWVHFRAGQFKRPFSRQQITSSSKLEFVERSPTDKAFFGGRDIGVMIHNNYEKSPEFEYAFGIFNGTGDKPNFSGDVTVDMATGDGRVTAGGFSNVPPTIDPVFTLRVGYNYGGIKGYSEADLEGGPFRFGVGANALSSFDVDDDDSSLLLGELDYVAKLYGFSATGGLFLGSNQSGGKWVRRSFDAVGMHVQMGYVIAQLVQPVLKYAFVAPRNGDPTQHEAAVATNVYFFSHDVKLATDAAALFEDGADTEYRLRAQIQLAF